MGMGYGFGSRLSPADKKAWGREFVDSVIGRDTPRQITDYANIGVAVVYEAKPKPKRGRPKGSKNKPKAK